MEWNGMEWNGMYVCMYDGWMDGCVRFHRHSDCDGLCPRCLTFVLLSNCPCLVHDQLYCFPLAIVLGSMP